MVSRNQEVYVAARAKGRGRLPLSGLGLVPCPNSSTHQRRTLLLLPCLLGRAAQGQMLWGGSESVWPLSSLPALPCPLQPPSGTITYSVGEGKYWKSGDLQFLQKRNSLAKSLPVLVL